MKKRLMLTPFVLALLVCAAPLLAGEEAGEFEFETGPEELENSAGWGIDLDTGKVAVDAGLIYFLDAENSTFILNPNRAEQAAEDLGAEVQADGNWRIEGKTYTPVVAELAIDSGQEPEELFVESRLPRVAYDRVNVVNEIGARALKARAFRKCKNCTDFPCPWDGQCFGNALYSNTANPERPGSCKFAWLKSCKQRWEPLCDVTLFNCLNCTGGVSGTTTLWRWACYDC